MALPSSPELLEELLTALQNWEWILFDEYQKMQHTAATTNYGQMVAAARRQDDEEELLKAQHRRASFLRTPAARFVVPSPFDITFWLDTVKKLTPVPRPRGALKDFRTVPTRPRWLKKVLAQSGRLGMVEAVTGWLGENAPTDSVEARTPGCSQCKGQALHAKGTEAPETLRVETAVHSDLLGEYELCEVPDMPHDELVRYALNLHCRRA